MTQTMTTAVAKQPQKPNKNVAVAAFKKVAENKYYQQLMQNALKENAGAFATSMMELVTSDENLLQCDPNELMAEAIKAASLRLPLNKQLGQCYILPFKSKGKLKPSLVIGVKGYVNLALRTGKYETLNMDVVYEGEYGCFNKITGELQLNPENKKSNTPIGYFAYMRKKDGFAKILYMTIDEICAYAKAFAPTVKYSNIDANGLKEIALKQSAMIFNDGVGWFQNFESMALKTVLRRLLSKWGELTIDDKGSQKIESMDEAMPSEFTRDNGFAEAKEILSVDAKTGEIIGGADTEPSEASSGLSKPLGEKAGDADDDNPFD